MNRTEMLNRTLLERMNQELLLSIDSTLVDLSLVIAMGKVFDGKDALPQEERFNDSAYQQVDSYQSILLPYFRKAKSGESAFHSVLMDSHLIPLNLQEDLDEMLTIREESFDITSSPFSPYLLDEEDFEEAKDTFALRLLLVYRIKSWINDIILGIQDYGVDPYKVDEARDNEECINLLDGIYDLSHEEVLQELHKHLLIDEDEKEEAMDKQSLIVLLAEIEKPSTTGKGKTHHD